MKKKNNLTTEDSSFNLKCFNLSSSSLYNTVTAFISPLVMNKHVLTHVLKGHSANSPTTVLYFNWSSCQLLKFIYIVQSPCSQSCICKCIISSAPSLVHANSYVSVSSSGNNANDAD